MGLLSRVKTWIAETLTASDLNAEFNNILNNLTPTYVEDASADATAMQATEDPYPGSSESLATNLLGEVKRLRYVLKQITGEAQWYIDPDTDLATHFAATAIHGATGAVVGTTNAQTLTNKTLTTPTIADFTNATHTHANAAGGGAVTIAASAVTSGTFGAARLSDVLGAWDATKVKDTVYQATTDLEVYARKTAGGVASTVTGYTDSSNPPTTVRDSTHHNDGADSGSINFVVKKNDYWKVTGSDTIGINIIPIGA